MKHCVIPLEELICSHEIALYTHKSLHENELS